MRVAKWLIVAVVVATVVIAGAVIGDGIVRRSVEQQVAQALAVELNLPEEPAVSLGGSPFSVALLTRSIPSATADAAIVPMTISGYDLTLLDVHVDGTDVTFSDTEIVIGQLAADATLSYADLTTLAGTPVGYEEPGRLRATYTAQIFGLQVEAGASAVPQVDVEAQAVTLDDPTVSVAGFALTPEISQFVINQLVKPIDVSLEDGLTLQSVVPTEAGLRLHVTATDFRAPLA